MHRTYENDNITVFWNSDKCRHAKVCVTGCPGVFDFKRKPWVMLDKDLDKNIWQTVEKCPSGALTITYNHGVTVSLDKENKRSIAMLDGRQIGECDYEETSEGFNIYHTEVDPEHSGKGIVKRLVYKVFEAAERAGAAIVPTCSYAQKVLNE
jgi:uncharacterized Fe-S cluster protein YjdI